MKINLDRESRTPLYLQIKNQVRQLILGRVLQPGYRLPPERKLAAALGVNRSTVVNAYRELEADGLIESHVGRGTVVKYVPDRESGDEAYSTVQPPAWKNLFSSRASRMFNPFISDMLELVTSEDTISLAVGVPAREFHPSEDFNNIISGLINKEGGCLFEHGPTAGHYPLREYLAQFMRNKGIQAGPDNIIILSGSQQGLDLAAKVLIEPGDPVVIEEQTYMGAIQVFATAGARILSVPMDEEGMRLDILEQLVSRYRPKLIYTQPTYQNPSGITMSGSRRRDLLRLVYRFHVPVIEDDPYSELCFEGGPVSSLKSLDAADHVIYLSTFSKMLFPGLRLGWMAAPADLVRQLLMAKQLDDLHTNSLAQWAVNKYCREGLLQGHLEKVRGEYHKRRDAMLASLAEYAPSGLRWSRPAGGFHVWCRLPEGVQAGSLLAYSVEKKVAFVPGGIFYANGGGKEMFRLSFSRCSPARIRKGISIICDALRDLSNTGPDHKKDTRHVREEGQLF
ncbi:PLP-dependent aminotransferase family protein [Pelotomaculum propionicicum]|uniref:MocR-like pyridoxine biosynthesis transcription factor PdxR n=1 Tax=Pelotomaculum propionicicum TaxID=258475 RepID=UPI003B771957